MISAQQSALTERPLPPAGTVAVPAGAGVETRLEGYLREKTRQVFGQGRPAAAVNEVEAIHQMRVASRRLRVGLRLFAAGFPEGELRQVRRQLRRITRALGEIRALDVNRRVLRKLTAKLPPRSRPAGAALEQGLLVERAARVAELWVLRQNLEAGRVPEQVQALVAAPQRRRDRQRLLREATAELDDLRRALRRRHRQFLRTQGRGAFHKFRLAAKRYRYALEAGQAVFQVAVSERLQAVHALQDVMGDCHDVEVLCQHLERAAARAAARDKTLAAAIRQVLKLGRREQDKRFAQFEAFLAQGTPWRKKIKLRVGDE